MRSSSESILEGERVSELSSFSHLSSFSKDGIRLVILLIMVAAKSAKKTRQGNSVQKTSSHEAGQQHQLVQ